MRRGLRVLMWLVVLVACAGVGASIASRTDPFPPGVEDPGDLEAGSSPSATPRAIWSGRAVVRSVHRLYVGGACHTNWRVRFSLEGTDGDGTARLIGEPRCDFPTAQLQAERLRFRVTSEEVRSGLRLRFSELASDSAGTIDLGGLLPLLERTGVELRVSDGKAVGRLERTTSDGERGEYAIRGRVLLTQRA
jgi:hypothetical protein